VAAELPLAELEQLLPERGEVPRRAVREAVCEAVREAVARGCRPGNDEGNRSFAQNRGGLAHHRHPGDAGAVAQHFLDLPRVDLLPAAVDDAVDPAEEVQEAAAVAVADVAGAQP